MRSFDVFTETLSPAQAGLFCASRFPARALLPTPNSHDTPIVVGVCPICDLGAPESSSVPALAKPQFRCPIADLLLPSGGDLQEGERGAAYRGSAPLCFMM